MNSGNPREDIKKVLDDVDQRVGPGFEGRHWDLYSFPQTWGSTALGFGGIGGCAMTTAQTYVVLAKGSIYVYFGSRFAYEIKNYLHWKFVEFLKRQHFPAVKEKAEAEKLLQGE